MFFKKREEELIKRQRAFNQMSAAYERLIDLRDAEHDLHNDVISEAKNLLEAVISQTIPLPRESTEKDYYAKTIEYVALYKLSKSIITSEQFSRDINAEDMKINWSDPLNG